MVTPALSAAPINLLDDPAFFRCEPLHVTIKKTVCVDRMMELAEIENGEMPPSAPPPAVEEEQSAPIEEPGTETKESQDNE